MRHLRTTITSILILALLLGGFGLAQTHVRGGPGAWMRGPTGAAALADRPTALPRLAGWPGFAGLPIGTTVELAFHDGDPAGGAAAVTTLAFTVGVDSEVAFGAEFAAAREAAAAWDAPFLVVTTGEQTRTVVFAEDDTVVGSRRLHGDALGRLNGVGMSEGDTISVTLYEGDPAAGGSPLQTLSFVYGVDSEIGFRAALRDAANDADAAVVVTGPRSVTIDLDATQARMDDARSRFGARGQPALPFVRMDVPRRLLPGRAR